MSAAGPTADHADEAGSRPVVLFVCFANVCRSPAMAFLTASALRHHGLAASWDFTSAGTSAFGEELICPDSASLIEPLPFGPEFARAHRSRPLTQSLVSGAALILVTSRSEGSVVARLSPPARARTFTIVEAALLSEKAVERGVTLRSGGSGRHATGHHGGEPEPATPDQLAEAMRANRGLLPSSEPPGALARLTRRRPARSLDIDDAHTGTATHHEPVLEDLRWASTRLADCWARLGGLDF